LWVFPDRTPLAAHPGVAAGPLLGLRVGNDRERLRPTLQMLSGQMEILGPVRKALEIPGFS
jgi:hypothetical protein